MAKRIETAIDPMPSVEAMNAVVEIEEAERKQCANPDDWEPWTPAYRRHIARKIDSCFRGRLAAAHRAQDRFMFSRETTIMAQEIYGPHRCWIWSPRYRAYRMVTWEHTVWE